MSCNCQNTSTDGKKFPCTCDDFVFPQPLEIGAGLMDIPRQIAGFPEFRRAMLYAVRSKTPLASWHATKPDDMGLMLLEMWAYVCDTLAFYDKIIAEEIYIGTANQQSSLRKLVALLGYLPAPAVAAIAKIAAKASGRQPVKIPMGTSFRSGAFDGNPPQIFELDKNALIDPFANDWLVSAPHIAVVAADGIDHLFVLAKITPKEGAQLLLIDTTDHSKNIGLLVQQVVLVTDTNGNRYTKISFTGPTNLRKGKLLSELQLMMPSGAANIIKMLNTATRGIVELDVISRQIKVGDFVLVSGTRDIRWFQILLFGQTTTTGPQNTVTINGNVFLSPGISTTGTALELDDRVTDMARGNIFIEAGTAPDWSNALLSQLILHYGMQSVGTITDLTKSTLAPANAVSFAGTAEVTANDPLSGEFLMQDVNSNGALVTGTVNFSNFLADLSLDNGQGWSPDLSLPVHVFGNVLTISRGQTVSGEVLGNGDASSGNQTFKLQKKPLTYLFAPSAENNQGVKNTLAVYVNNIRWSEVPSYYGHSDTEQIYIVRQNDAGESLVIFGDGIRGQRLPTGTSNIVANYRYGAGRASPPAGSINQIGKAVKGLQSISNTIAAYAGADAEEGSRMRVYAPKSALILGRAVSIDDVEAVALAFPGVITAQTEWRWDKTALSPVIHVWYIGDPSLAANLFIRLTDLMDPTMHIHVKNAGSVTVSLSVSVDIDPRYVTADVVTAVQSALLDSEKGLLATGNLGIGKPLFRSQLFEAVYWCREP